MSSSASSSRLVGAPATLVTRYIAALYALAEEGGVVSIVEADMCALDRLGAESPEWRMIGQDPRLGRAARRRAVEETTRLVGFSDLTQKFLFVLAKNHRLSLTSALAEGFLHEAEKRRGEHRAEAHVAAPLSPAQYEALAAALTRVAGGKTHVTVVEDPTLLGGLTVRLGDLFMDASVKARLDRLERALKASAVA